MRTVTSTVRIRWGLPWPSSGSDSALALRGVWVRALVEAKGEKKEKNCGKQVPSLGMGPRFVSAPRLETADKPRPLAPPVP